MNKIFIIILLILFVALDAVAQESRAVSPKSESSTTPKAISTKTTKKDGTSGPQSVAAGKGSAAESKSKTESLKSNEQSADIIGTEDVTTSDDSPSMEGVAAQDDAENQPAESTPQVSSTSIAPPAALPDEQGGKSKPSDLSVASVKSAQSGAKETETAQAQEAMQVTDAEEAHKQKTRKPGIFVKAKPFPENTEGRVQLAFPCAWIWRNDTGYDLFTSDNRFGVYGANLEVDFWRLHPRMVLSAGATWLRERASSKKVMSGSFFTKWKADSVTLHVKYRFRLLSWINLHARLQGGIDYIRASVIDRLDWMNMNTYYTPKKSQFVGGIGGGFSLHTPSVLRFKTGMPILSLGVLLEGGVLFGPAVNVDLNMSGGTKNSIDVHSQSQGKLSRTAPYLRADLFIRF